MMLACINFEKNLYKNFFIEDLKFTYRFPMEIWYDR